MQLETKSLKEIFLQSKGLTEKSMFANGVDANIYKEFESLVAKNNYKNVIDNIINSSIDLNNKLKELISLCAIVKSDEKFDEELFSKCYNGMGDSEFYDNVIIEFEDYLKTALISIYNKEYEQEKEKCEKVISEIKARINDLENKNTDWQEENIIGYERATFDYIKTAQEMIKSNKFSLLQILTGIYKTGQYLNLMEREWETIV